MKKISVLAVLFLGIAPLYAATPYFQYGYGQNSSTVTMPNGGTEVTAFTGNSDFTSQPTSIVRTDPITGQKSTETLTYDSSGRPISYTDGAGNQTTIQYQYQDSDLPEAITIAANTPLALVKTYAWSGGTNFRLPGGVYYGTASDAPHWIFNYSSDQLHVTQASFTYPNQSGQNIGFTWNYTYNSNNLLATASAPAFTDKGVMTYTYNDSGQLATITNPLKQVVKIGSYNANGRPTSITDVNGNAHTFTYNQDDQLLTASLAGTKRTFTYDKNGKLASYTDADGVVTDFAINYWGHLTQVTDGLGNTDSFTLNSQGKPTQETIVDKATGDTVFKQSATYDGFNRLKTLVDAAGDTTTFTYDAAGNIASITDAKGNKNSLSYNAQNNLAGNENALSNSIKYTYDPMGNVLSVTDFNGNQTTYTYTPLNQLATITSPISGKMTYSYDPTTGLLTSATDADKHSWAYTYDAVGRLATITSGSEVLTFGYDHGTNGIGHLTGISSTSKADLAFTYNPFGSVTQIQATEAGASHDVTYAYTDAQRIKSITYPDGKVVNYAYDKTGHVSGMTLGTAAIASDITYMPFGPLKALTFGNGAVLTRTYNQNYQLTHQTIGNIDDDRYAYDKDGNITTLTNSKNPSLSKTYTYDAVNRVTAVKSSLDDISYTYDANDNRLTQVNGGKTTTYTYTPTKSDHLTDVSTGSKKQAVVTDADGNITQFGSDKFTYNAFDQLASATTSQGSATYTYNGLGQRVVKTVGGKNTIFVYGQFGKLLEIISPTATTDFVYLYGQPVAMVQGDTVYYYISNAQGTPQYLMDKSANLPWEANIRPFDVFPNGNTNTVKQPLRFPGQVADTTTGYIYNNARDYAPILGRYLQPDPLGLAGSYNNLYSYAFQNPVNFSDPSGLMPPNNLPNIERAAPNALNQLGNDAEDAGDLALILAPEADAALLGVDAAEAGLEEVARVEDVTQAGKDGPVCADNMFSSKASKQISPPGWPRTIEHHRYNPRTNQLERSMVHYDKFGRQIGRTDYTHHGYPDNHSVPHHHTTDYGPGYPFGKNSGPMPGSYFGD